MTFFENPVIEKKIKVKIKITAWLLIFSVSLIMGFSKNNKREIIEGAA